MLRQQARMASVSAIELAAGPSLGGGTTMEGCSPPRVTVGDGSPVGLASPPSPAAMNASQAALFGSCQLAAQGGLLGGLSGIGGLGSPAAFFPSGLDLATHLQLQRQYSSSLSSLQQHLQSSGSPSTTVQPPPPGGSQQQGPPMAAAA
ncbi:hypothetical protein BIW11_04506, partial [Tropilaelaps mercedesae]